jgi:hypothetical protein
MKTIYYIVNTALCLAAHGVRLKNSFAGCNSFHLQRQHPGIANLPNQNQDTEGGSSATVVGWGHPYIIKYTFIENLIADKIATDWWRLYAIPAGGRRFRCLLP